MELFDSDQDMPEQPKTDQWKGERKFEKNHQEEKRYTTKREIGQREGVYFGSTSGVKNIRGRGKYMNKGRGGRGRG